MRKIYFDKNTLQYFDEFDAVFAETTNLITVVDIAPKGSTFELWRYGERRFAFGYNEIEIKNGSVAAKRHSFAVASCNFPIESATLYEKHIDKNKFDEIVKAYNLIPLEI